MSYSIGAYFYFFFLKLDFEILVVNFHILSQILFQVFEHAPQILGRKELEFPWFQILQNLSYKWLILPVLNKLGL